MTVLDKASPPVEPAFPKPFIVMPVGIVAGLALGLILALLAEAADRRVRFPIDLEYAAPAPFLGTVGGGRRSRAQDRRVAPQPSAGVEGPEAARARANGFGRRGAGSKSQTGSGNNCRVTSFARIRRGLAGRTIEY